MGFDELAVHARDVYLPEVDARTWMGLQPSDDFQ